MSEELTTVIVVSWKVWTGIDGIHLNNDKQHKATSWTPLGEDSLISKAFKYLDFHTWKAAQAVRFFFLPPGTPLTCRWCYGKTKCPFNYYRARTMTIRKRKTKILHKKKQI